MKSVNGLCGNILKYGGDAAIDNERGNRVCRWFRPADRYEVDFADDFNVEGWLQFDTDQDASYFGVWVNPRDFRTLTYAEGDWTLVECPTKESYLEEIRDAIRFYGEGFIAKAIAGSGEVEIFRQDRNQFLEVA